MPFLARRDVRSLVRKLGAHARPSQQKEALFTIAGLSVFGGDSDTLVAIASAGAIPPLVQLLGPGSSAEVREDAAAALCNLAQHHDNQVAIAAAGAIPLLVQLLAPGISANVQQNAAAALCHLAEHAGNAITIAAAGAIPALVQLLGSGSGDLAKEFAALALKLLGHDIAENRATIAAAGASADVVVLEEMERLGIYDDGHGKEE
ncbi:hypothetical protein FOA52_004387 [Chlamydomonas sp. UWO 241]|nr:hypothetical protein FOA52_004387 [Chlamydomonas sp. UWO 241]